MVLDKLMSILAQMPMKSQKTVMRAIDFSAKPPSEVYQDIIHTMQSVAKSAAQRDILEVYAQMPISDADILAAFGDRAPVKMPLTFDDTQIEYIRDRIYRNRDGKFRLIPMGNNCSADAMPLDGLDADEKIIDAKLSVSRLNEIGGVEKFDGLAKLEEQPYEPPYDGVFKQLAPNLQRINIISSFDTQDPYGFFVRDDKMYRNVCAQMTKVNPTFVTAESLRRAMLLLFLVSGGKASEWEQLYRVIHFMVRCPDSASGIILYLNDFDAGGNGKSKLVSVLQTMFGDTFTAFAPQQLRFTMSLMGKRLVSISEFEGATTDQLQSIMKSMTGRDRFQYEGKGVVLKGKDCVFVSGVFPGESGEFEISYRRNGSLFGKVKKLDVVSPDRVAPKCKICSSCGGCQFQQYAYKAQLLYKSKKVKEQFHKIGHMDVDVLPTIGMDKPYNYRNKIQMPFGKDARGNIYCGFYKENTHIIVPVTECYIEDKRAAKILQTVKKLMKSFHIEPYDEDARSGVLRTVRAHTGAA